MHNRQTVLYPHTSILRCIHILPISPSSSSFPWIVHLNNSLNNSTESFLSNLLFHPSPSFSSILSPYWRWKIHAEPHPLLKTRKNPNQIVGAASSSLLVMYSDSYLIFRTHMVSNIRMEEPVGLKHRHGHSVRSRKPDENLSFIRAVRII